MRDWNWDGTEDGYEYSHEPHHRRLTRNSVDGKLGGVCAGIGDYLGWDHTMVRMRASVLMRPQERLGRKQPTMMSALNSVHLKFDCKI